MRRWRIGASFAVLFALVVAALPSSAQAQGPFGKINHWVVIYQENWSFDGLYGKFPGVDGIDNAGAAAVQVDKNGVPYPMLPQAIDSNQRPPVPDSRFPTNLPNAPAELGRYVPVDMMTGDMIHRYYQEQYQINGGKMDKFVAYTDAGGLVMTYYDATNLPEGKIAQEYTISDRFFHAAFGGSFLNHFWMVCACSPTWPNAPESIKAQLDSNGIMTKDGQVTPDGYAINTSFSVNMPHPKTVTDPNLLVPQQTQTTIGDRLSEKNISWAWYSGGYDDALAGNGAPLFQYHHQPFVFFQNYADGTAAKAQHLKDEKRFFDDAKSGTLPAVSWVKPIGEDNAHPGYATVLRGQQHVADLVNAIQNGPNWNDTAIIITYDEHGGRWDHVAPPVADKWGPGARVPTIIASPFAKRHFVDHTTYDTTSILRTLETRYGIAPLGTRDASVNDLSNAFDFGIGGGGPGQVMPRTGLPLTDNRVPGLWLLLAAGVAGVGVGLRLRHRFRS